jgi:hypothetical protein
MNLVGKRIFCFSLTLLLASSFVLTAQPTKTIYLSGTGFDQTVEWEFYCSDGKKSGAWTTIEVPSCWERWISRPLCHGGD